MPHANLVVASGRKGGQLVRIKTYSSEHVVCVRMDFRNCAHGNVSPAEPQTPKVGCSQLRLIRYSRVDIAEAVRYYVDSPSCCMLEGERKSYLLWERDVLGMYDFAVLIFKKC
eukprot:4844904-Pleurochrysis_carterae.AAC.1